MPQPFAQQVFLLLFELDSFLQSSAKCFSISKLGSAPKGIGNFEKQRGHCKKILSGFEDVEVEDEDAAVNSVQLCFSGSLCSRQKSFLQYLHLFLMNFNLG